jgi:carbon storage regulator
MLVLTRKNREAVVVGGASCKEQVLKVTVLGVSANRVTLGFEASGEIPIHRAEVWDRIQEEMEIGDPEPDEHALKLGLPY